MKKMYNKLLTLVASSAFILAIQAVNAASREHIYQGEEPEALKKYKK
ncbi:cyclic lactone autoinducer peptide [Thomasclavelia cocleata]|jgi:cyclic lactone autoinducer peptide|uniref:Cyclic lactone autoinducer peptide n=1 Tax=Thomasclavelia cocleata TaxID=69824 RepID=A0A829ZCX0_9FIRM|nr:cyclic lactone autoinducer peptide [Thomasclavelia cocleata]MCI9132437.1 cyclic lactone autoinducer peptide [Thomasclavelia cocleata]MCI9631152.1 cyclic lactone autoinducer peptide [Thomasclavelia cocleata]GFI42243.1 hypothetical protein IMSAGC017_02290 [Thomasclavelia cocleata]